MIEYPQMLEPVKCSSSHDYVIAEIVTDAALCSADSPFYVELTSKAVRLPGDPQLSRDNRRGTHGDSRRRIHRSHP
jgi:hypothetical protein